MNLKDLKSDRWTDRRHVEIQWAVIKKIGINQHPVLMTLKTFEND